MRVDRMTMQELGKECWYLVMPVLLALPNAIVRPAKNRLLDELEPAQTEALAFRRVCRTILLCFFWDGEDETCANMDQ